MIEDKSITTILFDFINKYILFMRDKNKNILERYDLMSILKCGCFGIGNAGSQVASLATKYGFKSLCANASESDLNVLDGDVTTLLIGDGMGSGKDRNIAKSYVKENIKALISEDAFSQFINELQVVFVITSTSGGSGGGMGPILTDILSRKYKNTVFIYVGILPTYVETVRSQRNTLECLKEVVDIKMPYMLYDNNKAKDGSVSNMMDRVNKAIVQDLCVLRGDYNILSNSGMIDGRELTIILSTPGLINVTSSIGFKEKDLDDVSIEELLIKNLSTNMCCEIDRNRVIGCMGLITNLTKPIAQKFDPNIKRFKDVVGEPDPTYEHHYEIQDSEEETMKNCVHVISAGLSVPDDRLKKIVERIEEAEAMKKAATNSSILDNYVKTENVIEDNDDDFDLEDIINKY